MASAYKDTKISTKNVAKGAKNLLTFGSKKKEVSSYILITTIK